MDRGSLTRRPLVSLVTGPGTAGCHRTGCCRDALRPGEGGRGRRRGPHPGPRTGTVGPGAPGGRDPVRRPGPRIHDRHPRQRPSGYRPGRWRRRGASAGSLAGGCGRPAATFRTGSSWVGPCTTSRRRYGSSREVDWDYLALGTVFSSQSKPGVSPCGVGMLRAVARAVDVPVLAIGGVTVDRCVEVFRAGAAGVAAIGLFAEPGPSGRFGGIRRVVGEIRRTYAENHVQRH